MDAAKHPASAIDADLLARIAKGERDAFSQLYDQTSNLLFPLALRILGDRDAAADLLQDVYLEVWRKRLKYDAGRGSPMAWLVIMTRSRAIDRLRARAAKGQSVTDTLDKTMVVNLKDMAPSPAENSATSEVRGLVTKALTELPPDQRMALELAYYQGLSHSEIAAKLREPLGTIKTRIKLGMDKLRSTLKPCWGS